MEIADHLRRAGRWSWLLLILPLISALAAVAAMPAQQPVWISSATVLAPPAATGRSGGQYISDFQAALMSSSVIDKVVEQTGVTSQEALEGLSSQPLAPGSTLLQVTHVSRSEQAAGAVPLAAARFVLQVLIQPTIDAEQAQLAIAQEQYDAALRAREAYTQEIGVQLPGQAYQSGLSELSSLRNSAEVARLEGRDSAAGLLQQLEKRTAEVAVLAPQAVAYDLLQNDVERAYNEVNRLRFSLAATRSQLEATSKSGTVTPGDVVPQSITTQRIRPILTATAIGLVVAGLLISAILFLRQGRGSAHGAVDAASSEQADTAPAPSATSPLVDGPAGPSAPAPLALWRQAHPAGGQRSAEQHGRSAEGAGHEPPALAVRPDVEDGVAAAPDRKRIALRRGEPRP